MPFNTYMDDKTVTVGLAASLYDAVALAEIFGPGARIGIGDARDADILVPSGALLSPAEAAAAARLGRSAYFLAFGNAASVDASAIAPLIEVLSEVLGLGFMASCVAAPWAGRTVYQGQDFAGSTLKTDLIRTFSQALGGPVGLVAHQTVAQGAAAIRRATTRLKEQGRALALIDAINDQDCAAIGAACAGLPLAGGGAWLAAPPPRQAEPAPPQGRLAILAGALDRDTVLQVATARAAIPVFDLDFASPDPVADAASWAAACGGAHFVISSSVPPDRVTPGAPAAALFGAIARRLAGAGVSRFVLAGSETAAAVLAALGVRTLTAGAAWGKLRWLNAGSVDFCIKPSGTGAKNLFLPELEPQIRLNEPAN
jgi:uncharacterized protein YgbK (DUF1537 family)